jgi:hypothetical protein
LTFGATAIAGNPQEAAPPPAEPTEQPAAPQVADAAVQLAEFEISLDARDRAYQAQIAAAEQSLKEREAAYQAQLQPLQEKLAAQGKALAQEQAKLETAKANAAKLQKAVAAADVAFQSEMQTKTGQLSADETQRQDQIKQVYADLQAAYDELAARQANSGGGEKESEHDD